MAAELGQPLALTLGTERPAALSVCGLALAHGDRPVEITLRLASEEEVELLSEAAGRSDSNNAGARSGSESSSCSSSSDPRPSTPRHYDSRWKFLLLQPRCGAEGEGSLSCNLGEGEGLTELQIGLPRMRVRVLDFSVNLSAAAAGVHCLPPPFALLPCTQP